MPRGDGTGPMTGRGAGYCSGIVAPGCANPVEFLGGFGRGFSRGRGFRRMFCATGFPVWGRYGYPAYTEANGVACTEKEILSNRVELLEKQLQQVNKLLSYLKECEE